MSSIPQLVIAVDGHSSCGKSTFARAIAKMLGYIHIDSGAMYRAVTWRALEEGLIRGKDIHRERLKDLLPGTNITFVPDSAGETFRLHLNGIDIEDFIREPRVSDHVSDISALREVREFWCSNSAILPEKMVWLWMDGILELWYSQTPI